MAEFEVSHNVSPGENSLRTSHLYYHIPLLRASARPFHPHFSSLALLFIHLDTMLSRSKARALEEAAAVVPIGPIHPALRQAVKIMKMHPTDESNPLAFLADVAAAMAPKKDDRRAGSDLPIEPEASEIVTGIRTQSDGLDLLAEAASTLEAARTDTSGSKKHGREAKNDVANKNAGVGEVGDARAKTDAAAKNKEQHKGKSVGASSVLGLALWYPICIHT